jgi:hypothetical protein
MATIDRRGATVSAADPPIGTNPNPDLAIKAPVRLATTGSNITLSGLQTIDGVALAAGDRVLVKDQTDATTNGLYNAATGPWTRTIDANNNSQWARGTQIIVTDGTTNATTNWECTATSPITLGTSTLPFISRTIITIGGAAPFIPPTQNTPVTALIVASGVYNDSGPGNIFQIGSWVDNTGTRNSVAVFGQGRALGTNSRAWGGNFVGYTGAAGAFAQAIEIDFGVANGISSQQAWGLSLNAGGTTGTPGSNTVLGINFDSLGPGAVMTNAIRFNNAGLAQPYQNALLTTGNTGGAIASTFGVDFSNAAFVTAAIKTKGFLLDPNGGITSGAGGIGGSLTLNGATSGSAALTVSATGGAMQFLGGLLSLGASGVAGQLTLAGATSGAITLKTAAIAGSNTLTLPAGTTDFSATGGTSQVVKQTSAGGAFTVAQLATSDLSDIGTFSLNTSGTIKTTNATASTTTTTGALVATGGLGIGGALNVGGTIASGLNGGTGGQLTLNGATSGSISLAANAGSSVLSVAFSGGTTNVQFTNGALFLGNNGSASGSLVIQGSTSGSVTLTTPAASGGLVQFSSGGSFSANGSVATVLGSIGPVGSHTTVQTWLTIVDNTGATRYIPAF